MWLWEIAGRLSFKKKRVDYFIKIEVFFLCSLLIYGYVNEESSSEEI